MEKTWAPPTLKTPMAFPTFPQLRRLDLYREILLSVEEHPNNGQLWTAVRLREHSVEDVVAHTRLLEDAGLVVARFGSPVGNEFGVILRMTNDGYEFLEDSRQLTFWEKAKEHVKSAGVPLTVYALKQAFDIIVKDKLK
jgi:hypothetical protein